MGNSQFISPIHATLRAAVVASGIDKATIAGPYRFAYITRWRWAGIFIARATTDASPSAIGRVYRRDRTSVLYALRKVEADPGHYRPQIDAIKAVIDGEAG